MKRIEQVLDRAAVSRRIGDRRARTASAAAAGAPRLATREVLLHIAPSETRARPVDGSISCAAPSPGVDDLERIGEIIGGEIAELAG